MSSESRVGSCEMAENVEAKSSGASWEKRRAAGVRSGTSEAASESSSERAAAASCEGGRSAPRVARGRREEVQLRRRVLKAS